ncbi:pyruvate:ferredoxin (flavodoxin) oxidoreductase [Desertimonas flava]|uniref:pyruvate:ferredoxin (flavodoxin) oxidoreductase n=1 Tax=Desertimonas flava TaxID=2064846 RepID=UPI000E3492AB|nr:pyruvate:ferredoxin (flavodoxin) oxidoreductase [Desertimonas flava]
MSNACMDGNHAAALVGYALSEVAAIYPITPSSPMGEHADEWAAAGRANVWGSVPEIVEMQSEAGAAGALHGALQAGTLATTFTASQGLLLMLPNMFKIAGELTPSVIHVAARAVATHALSIFGDHSDVMAARTTGWAMLCASSVQEAHDFALVAHAATLRTRVPFLHFFDGFRTSHEVNRVELLGDDDLLALVGEDRIVEHKGRRLRPSAPVLRGTAQNPDVFFQAREAASPFHAAVPGVVATVFDELAARTGRQYHLVDYQGAPDAERVVVVMGSGAGAVGETVERLVAAGERVGLLTVRLFRPFPVDAFLASLPAAVRSIAVLDRTKEPGSVGEPLLQDVVTALADSERPALPRVIGGRYGLGSKEFTPAMAKAVFDELVADAPKRRFTIGIVDDVSGSSLSYDREFRIDDGATTAVFYALGSDGTVGANKASVDIISSQGGRYAQGYFVYDSKKSGSMTVSHLRFGDRPIRSTYLIDQADFVACHQFVLLDRVDVVGVAKPGATLLLNAPYGPGDVWAHLPDTVRTQIVDKGLKLFVIDAARIARELGMPGRINTVMQPCFFALVDVLPRDEAIAAIKDSIATTYGRRGAVVVERNVAAVERALSELAEVTVPDSAGEGPRRSPAVAADAPDFVQRVTARILAGEGDLLPVSALPVDGTFPVGSAAWEKRKLAELIPVWEPDLCIDCGKCAIVCPHAVIRMKAYEPDDLARAPDGFLSKSFRSRDLPGRLMTIQVSPDDCTGCSICVEVCPAKDKSEVKRKAINMAPYAEHADVERERWDFFTSIPELDRAAVAPDSVKTSQLLEPLFEFSGACAGCGETPYLKLLTQLFGDRLVVANATGCSSIYGGNLPTTPWAANSEGLGPAWANSLFEDNAEFGLGIRLGVEHHQREARRLLTELAGAIGPELAGEMLATEQSDEAGVIAQRRRLATLIERLDELAAGDDRRDPRVARLRVIAAELVRSSVWLVGGDGWAYDIGFGGLDHVLASGRNVNVLVLDTEVYSNTGGQASKATPRGAVAKFATAGKPSGKKDLGAIARSYGNVYVAQVALGGSDVQTVKALLEADAWDGPSLIIAYSTCIAHGIDMATSMAHQRDAVRSGYWPLYRFRPAADEQVEPFQLDSAAPSIPLRDFALAEARFAMLARTDPERSDHLLSLAQGDIDERRRYYEQLARVHRTAPGSGTPPTRKEP